MVFVTQNVDYLVKAQSVTILPNVDVTIQSPENKTYTESTVPLVFTINSSYTALEYSDINHPSQILEHGCILDYSIDNLVQQLSNNTPHESYGSYLNSKFNKIPGLEKKSGSRKIT